MPSERLTAYLVGLGDLSEDRIRFGCVEALKHCKFFPQVSELRDFAFRWVPPAEAKPPAIFREDKPPGWEHVGRKAGFSRDQVLEMLEAGKESQREYIAKLEADPQWCAMRDKLVQKDFKSKPTNIPGEPDERAKWATGAAQQAGWLK